MILTLYKLNATQFRGRPGWIPSITLRGGTNFDGSVSALIVAGGQIRGLLSEINPSEIESIEVLKDASTTALYAVKFLGQMTGRYTAKRTGF